MQVFRFLNAEHTAGAGNVNIKGDELLVEVEVLVEVVVLVEVDVLVEVVLVVVLAVVLVEAAALVDGVALAVVTTGAFGSFAVAFERIDPGSTACALTIAALPSGVIDINAGVSTKGPQVLLRRNAAMQAFGS